MWLDHGWGIWQHHWYEISHRVRLRFRTDRENSTGALVMDKIGRKPLMILGVGGCLTFVVVELAMVARYASPLPIEPNEAGLKAAVAML